MFERSCANAARYLSGMVLLFAVIAYRSDFRHAAFVTACLIVGYMNLFGVLHGFVAALKRKEVPLRQGSVAVLALGASAGLTFAGYGLVLVLATASFLIIDVLVLRFR